MSANSKVIIIMIVHIIRLAACITSLYIALLRALGYYSSGDMQQHAAVLIFMGDILIEDNRSPTLTLDTSSQHPTTRGVHADTIKHLVVWSVEGR